MIFKIVQRAEWAEAARLGHYAGSAKDQADGFLHFSNADQVAGTLARYYADADDLVLVAVDEARLTELKWETSRDGALFPHLYSELEARHALWARALKRNEDGLFILPF